MLLEKFSSHLQVHFKRGLRCQAPFSLLAGALADILQNQGQKAVNHRWRVDLHTAFDFALLVRSNRSSRLNSPSLPHTPSILVNILFFSSCLVSCPIPLTYFLCLSLSATLFIRVLLARLRSISVNVAIVLTSYLFHFSASIVVFGEKIQQLLATLPKWPTH